MLIYSDPIKKRYYAPFFSFAGFSVLFFHLGLVIAAFLIAFTTDGFWLKTKFVVEQPLVRFKKEMILVASGISSTKNSFNVFTWSTFSDYNLLSQNSLRVPLVQTYENDSNYDGIYESLNFEIQIPLADDEVIQDVKLLLFFDYNFRGNLFLEMESLAYIHFSSPFPGSSFSANGDLNFHQKSRLSAGSTRTLYNQPIVNSSLDVSAYRLEAIFKSYNLRNDTTVFDNKFPVWNFGRGRSQPFVFTGNVLYPAQTLQL
eukprot:Sdes_comp8808_c0_seq1m194